MTRWTVKLASRMYSIPLIDYCDGDALPDRWGVLFGSGCGLMMAVMDEVPFRFCIDTDTLDLRAPGRAYALAQFVTMASCVDEGGVALVGSFSISDPAPLRQAFAGLARPGVVYVVDVRLGVPGEVDSLGAFLAAARARWAPFTVDVEGEPFVVNAGDWCMTCKARVP